MLTPSQLATVKADILADSTLNAFPNNPDGNTEIAKRYNLIVSPNYWVWRSSMSQSEVVGVTSVDGTVWSWTLYINRSQGERDGWREMFADTGTINPSLANVRQGLNDIFSGAGGLPQRTHLLTVGRRLASRLEKLLATGAGTTATPSNMNFEGNVTFEDVQAARES